MKFNIWKDCPKVPITELLSFIVDNRGKTVPNADDGWKLIATNCVTNNTLFPVYEKVRYLTQETYETWFRAHPIPGDILFVNKGTPGRVCLVPDPVDFCIAQDMIALRADDEKIYNKYLFAVLRSREIQQQIYNTNVGDVIPHFKKQFMDQLLIPVPDRRIQEIIGNLYYELSYKTELNKKINKNLEQQAQAIFKSWFIDFHPFGGNTPFITIPDMHGCVYNVSTERYLSSAGVASQPKKTLPPNTVCVSCIGTAGLVTLVSEKSQSNQQINSIVPKEGISVYYIYLLMQTLSETINKLGQSGSTIVNLNKTQFAKIPVTIPSEQVLCNFDTLCKPLFEMILSNQKENIKLTNLRDTLLPKLMSGELDVSGIDL